MGAALEIPKLFGQFEYGAFVGAGEANVARVAGTGGTFHAS
jgi:hypothetical protein